MLNKPIFEKMKNKPLWTVSSNKKIPLDLQWFIEHKDKPNAIKGAKYQDERSLGTFYELEEHIPNHANATYYYQMSNEDYLFLDIEPKCPDNIKQHLLQLPYVYGETSMSGKGIHLLIPKPKNINDFPDALIKTQLKGFKGYYELLVNHYATFTGKEIPLPTNINDFTEKLYKSLAQDVIATKSIELMDSEKIDIEDIPYHNEIIELVMRKPFEKDISDYEGDKSDGKSEYEFGMMNYYAHRIYQRANLDIFKAHKYTNDELLNLLYYIIKNNLEHRPKHDEKRNINNKSVNFLFWRCNAAMSQTIDYYENNKNKNKKDKK